MTYTSTHTRKKEKSMASKPKGNGSIEAEATQAETGEIYGHRGTPHSEVARTP
jgi:hypothetical protein